jgi:uncharacterized protein (TIGR00255 family)
VILSMTGFGSASFRCGETAFEVEIRSVNHRHLDARVRVPRVLSSLEPELRTRIQARFDRGKFDCSIASPEGSAPAPKLEIDYGAARAYLDAARRLTRTAGARGELDVAGLLALPGVSRFVEPEVTPEAVREACNNALDLALDALGAMRQQEGESLCRDMQQRLATVLELASVLEGRAADVVQSVREKLKRRARQLESETGLLDEARLHQEVTIAAERLDVTEEIVRLRSHVEQFQAALAGAGPGQPTGRRLDFLLQELSREANTIGSKGSDAPIAHTIVDLKTELERLREQVQNVE